MSSIVGIDLSLTATGLAEIRDGKIASTVRVRTVGKKTDTIWDRQARLSDIADRVVTWVNGDDTDLVVIEAPSYGSVHGSQHDRSGLWWLVVQALAELEIPFTIVAPQARAKYGTGKGNAAKAVVLQAVRARFPHDTILIPDDNVADAILLACMGARLLGEPIDGDLDPKCLEALTKVVMPEELAA